MPESYVEFANRMTREGYRLWSDHPGFTIARLNDLLEPHGLRIETCQTDPYKPSDVWFRVVAIEAK